MCRRPQVVAPIETRVEAVGLPIRCCITVSKFNAWKVAKVLRLPEAEISLRPPLTHLNDEALLFSLVKFHWHAEYSTLVLLRLLAGWLATVLARWETARTPPLHHISLRSNMGYHCLTLFLNKISLKRSKVEHHRSGLQDTSQWDMPRNKHFMMAMFCFVSF